MGAPVEPIVLAEQGGLVVAERGPDILIIDRGNGASDITAFVLLVCTLVFGGFGVVSVFYAATGAMAPGSVAVGVVLLVVGIASGIAMVLTTKATRGRRMRPLSSFAPVAVLDRAHRVYRNGAGELIAPLDHVRFERQIQLTSSSAKLVAVTPSGDHLIKRGNPFGGGIGRVDAVLNDMVGGSTR